MAIDNNADFTPSIPDSGVVPTKLPYNPTGSFKFWAQKVIPLVYDDSLSYYEVLCKVVTYLNNVIQNVDNLNDSVDSTNQSFATLEEYVNTTKDTLISTYNELQNYVNTYFDNLDVQEEINEKLDAMADSGELTTLLAPFIPDLVTSWLNTHVDPVGSAVIVDDTLSISGAAADAATCGILKNAYKPYITDYKTVMYGDEVSLSSGEQVYETGKRILLDGTVEESDAYTIWKLNMSDKYAYRIYMHPGGDYKLIRFIQLEDYDGNVVGWIRAESADYQTKYIAGFNGVCKITHRNYYAGNNKKFETDLSLAITKIENGECKNLIGTEPNKLYYGHIPAGRKFTISTYDGNPPSSVIKLNYYAKDKTYLDFWTLNTSQTARSVSDDNEIYWWSFDKELPTKIQLEINSEKTSFEEHYDNERTIENDINTGKYEFYKKASDFSSGYEINTYTGEKTANSNYRYVENIPVTPGQKIYFNGRFGSIYPGIAGYDKNGSYLKAVYNNSVIPDYDDSQKTYEGKEVVIPDGVFFISYSTRYDGTYGYLIYSYKDKNRGYYESTFEQKGTLYDTEMQDTVEKYEACLTSAGNLMLTFALFTDLHHDPKYQNDPINDMFKNISVLNNYVNFDALFNLGDAIDGQFSTKYRAETLLKDVYDLEKDVTPFNYNLIGNHDDNIQSTWPDRGNLPASNQLTNLEFASISNKNNRNIIRNANRPTDYYIDFDEYDIRVVVISPQYVTYVSATQTWLNQEALVTDKKVIVLSHCATKAKWGFNNDIANGAIIESALKTFVNNGGELIVYIHGHTHGDLIETDSDISWTEVSVGCAMFDNFTPSSAYPEGLVVPARNKDNYTKILFDLVCVDLTNRKVKFIRCGAGNDYEVNF